MTEGRLNKRVATMRNHAVRDTVLLTHFDAMVGGNVDDDVLGVNAWATGLGAPAIDPVNKAFGAGALSLSSAGGDYMVATALPATIAPHTNPFTISCWTRALPPTNFMQMLFGGDSVTADDFFFYVEINTVVFLWETGGVQQANYSCNLTGIVDFAVGLHDVELVRYGAQMLLFVDGLLRPWTLAPLPITAATDLFITAPDSLWVGYDALGAFSNSDGQIDELRLVVGHAAHLSNYTPMDRAYTIFDL